jgi:hypothetical protein
MPPLLGVGDAAADPPVERCTSEEPVMDAVIETPAKVAAEVSAELDTEVVAKDELLVTVVA